MTVKTINKRKPGTQKSFNIKKNKPKTAEHKKERTAYTLSKQISKQASARL